MTSLRSALCFFTRLPVGRPDAAASFAGAVAWYPVIGLVVGLVAGLITLAASCLLPPLVCGALGCLAWAAVTGGLHLDGVADCGDGMLVEASRERRLEIMKDPRLGTFGALALFFVLLVKFASLASLAAGLQLLSPAAATHFLMVCILAAVLARCANFAAMRLPSARPGGMGSMSVAGLTARHSLAAALAALFVSAASGLTGLAALLAAAAMTGLFLSAAKKRLGGVTGDVYGCLTELVECTVLVAACCLP